MSSNPIAKCGISSALELKKKRQFLWGNKEQWGEKIKPPCSEILGCVSFILIGLDNAVCRQVLCCMNHIYRNIFQFLRRPRQGAAVHPPSMNISAAQGGLRALPARLPLLSRANRAEKNTEKEVGLGLTRTAATLCFAPGEGRAGQK